MGTTKLHRPVSTLGAEERRQYYRDVKLANAAQRKVWQDEIKSLNPGVIDEEEFQTLSEDETSNYVYRGAGLYTPLDVNKIALPKIRDKARTLYW
jgi:hypothetical protein